MAPRNPVATWIVELPVAAGVRALNRWTQCAIATLEAFPVWRAEELGGIGYRRAHHGALAAFLSSRADQRNAADLFAFHRVRCDPTPARETVDAFSRLTWYGEDNGPPIAGLVSSAGALLRTLRPDDVAAGMTLMGAMPPVWISGPLVCPETYRASCARVRIELYSDIWLPWVRGVLDQRPACDHWFDNRELAATHTPALNAALAELAADAARLGGSFALDDEPTVASALGQVDDRGVVLDANRPPYGLR